MSMAKISDASDISRQWLYKMGEFAGRKPNGNGASAAKATPAKRTTARKSTRTAGRGSATKKTTAAKPQIRRRTAA